MIFEQEGLLEFAQTTQTLAVQLEGYTTRYTDIGKLLKNNGT